MRLILTFSTNKQILQLNSATIKPWRGGRLASPAVEPPAVQRGAWHYRAAGRGVGGEELPVRSQPVEQDHRACVVFRNNS